MQFEAKSEKQLAESRPLRGGVYPFEILDAMEKTSAAGNPMIELSPTFAVGRVGSKKGLCFQYGLPKGLHYIFSGAGGCSATAVMRGGGWFGRVSLS